MEPIETFFEKQFERINYWLSFAEAKNTILVAFNISVIVAWRQLFTKNLFTLMIVILFVCSTIISLLSFLPKFPSFSKKHFIDEFNTDLDINLIYFGDISHIKSPEIYIYNITKKYFNDSIAIENVSMMVHDFAEEIILNSRIAMIKYILFKVALYINIIAIGLLIFVLIIK